MLLASRDRFDDVVSLSHAILLAPNRSHYLMLFRDRYNTMVNYMRLPGMGPSSMAQINPAVQEFQRDDGYVCQTFNDPQDAVR